MMIWKRAIRYVTRKRSKCLLLFMMLFIIGVFILSTLTVKRTPGGAGLAAWGSYRYRG